MSLHLGIGAFQEADAHVDAARDYLFTAIEEHAPKVVCDLHSSGLDGLDAWARRWHLVRDGIMPAWVEGVGRETLLNGASCPVFDHDVLGGWLLTAPNEEQIVFPQFQWRPSAFPAESKDQARARITAEVKAVLEKRLTEIERLCVARGQKTRSKDAAHFRLFVDFQVNGKPVRTLGRLSEAPAIRKALREVAAVVGLTLRHEKPGRPRK